MCRRNMARSPMAEYFCDKYFGRGVARSAGVDVGRQGDVVPFFVWEAMNEVGICMKHHRTTLLVSGMVERAERIYVLCERERCPDYLLESSKVEFWDVADPVDGVDSIRRVRDEIERRVLGLGLGGKDVF